MKKNLKLLMSSSLVTLTFLMFQTHSSQAMEEMEQITFIRSNGNRNRIKVNPDRTLSDLREELTNKQRIKSDDIFQKEGDDIFKDEEKDWKIRDAITSNTLSLKPKRSIFSSNPEKTKAKVPSADFKLDVPSSEDIKFHQPQSSVATTTNMDSYALLSGHDRHSLIESLRLTSAIDLIHIDSFEADSKDVTFCPSFRTCVIWQKKPDWQNPYRTLIMNTSCSLSKSFHELKKSNITRGTAGANFLGISVDSEYQSKSETLRRKEETEIYLLSTYDVPKVVLSIHKDYIQASPDLESKIENVFNRKNQEIDLYKKLISIFRDYGFCIPTRFVLGGQLYSEDKRKVTTIEDAKLAEAAFAGDVKASFFVASVSVGGGHANAESERNSQSHMTQAIQKLVTGGDPALTNDLSQWIASLGSWRQWRVIERGDFYPIIGFLKADLQTKCKSLIAKYYQDDPKQMSLAALNATLIAIEQPLPSSFLDQNIIVQIENQEPSRIKIQSTEEALAAVEQNISALSRQFESTLGELHGRYQNIIVQIENQEPSRIKIQNTEKTLAAVEQNISALSRQLESTLGELHGKYQNIIVQIENQEPSRIKIQNMGETVAAVEQNINALSRQLESTLGELHGKSLEAEEGILPTEKQKIKTMMQHIKDLHCRDLTINELFGLIEIIKIHCIEIAVNSKNYKEENKSNYFILNNLIGLTSNMKKKINQIGSEDPILRLKPLITDDYNNFLLSTRDQILSSLKIFIEMEMDHYKSLYNKVHPLWDEWNKRIEEEERQKQEEEERGKQELLILLNSSKIATIIQHARFLSNPNLTCEELLNELNPMMEFYTTEKLLYEKFSVVSRTFAQYNRFTSDMVFWLGLTNSQIASAQQSEVNKPGAGYDFGSMPQVCIKQILSACIMNEYKNLHGEFHPLYDFSLLLKDYNASYYEGL